MANRYWVGGGDRLWDGVAGTKWATEPEGIGGASVPTIEDDVFFDDDADDGTCTISTGNTGAKSINCLNFTGTIAGSAAITVAGSVTLAAGMTYSHTGTVTFTGTGTLTTAGKTFSGVTVDGVGITMQLGGALNIDSRVITVTQGKFTTNSFSVTAGGITSSNNNVRDITLLASTVTLSGGFPINFGSVTNFTFNAHTSQINLSAGNATLNGGGVTFHNVSFTSLSPLPSRTINGTNTFNNLSLATGGAGAIQLALAANQTVSGTLTCAGASPTTRGFVRSDIIGATRTITAATVSANDCDFRDITISGAAAPISPTRAGDCGGNTGITFPAAKTVYRVGTNTTWAGSSSWALTSGGAGSNNNFPLAQDTVVIDNSTTLTGTLALGLYNIGTLDASTRTTSITLNHADAVNRYGSYTLGSGVIVSGTSTQTFSGRATMVFTSAGKTITFPIVVDTPDGTFQLGDAFSSSSTLTHQRGTLNANNFNLTCTTFNSSNSNNRIITMGSGLWTLIGFSAVWTTALAINLTLNKNTADIILSNTSTNSRIFSGGGLSFNKLTIGGTTGTSILTIVGQNSFTEIASTKTVAHTVRLSNSQGTIDTWSITGTPGNTVTVDTSVVDARRTFNLTNVTSGIDYLSVRDIGVNQANRFYVGANSTDGGNNLNVIFTDPPTTTATGNFFILLGL